jgi:endonuclease/exonuclease/phosphatase family metal-dependent hydrolase
VQFSILTWNIHGKRSVTKTSFAKIAPALEELEADIMCFQEAHEMRERLSTIPALHTRHRVEPRAGFNQNLILSRLPISERGELSFPELSMRQLERALWADIPVGSKVVRIYNCHFGIFGSNSTVRAHQLRFVLNHAESHSGPVIVCGDLNTTIPLKGMQRKMVQFLHMQPTNSLYVEGEHVVEDERYAFMKIAERHGFREATDISQPTWRVAPFTWELFKLKLDWLLVRDVETPRVVLHPYISDHKAIHAECLLK